MVTTSYSYWSPERGANVMRIGATGADGRERYVMLDLDAAQGAERRRRRAIALEVLMRDLDRAPAGEITVSYDG